MTLLKCIQNALITLLAGCQVSDCWTTCFVLFVCCFLCFVVCLFVCLFVCFYSACVLLLSQFMSVFGMKQYVVGKDMNSVTEENPHSMTYPKAILVIYRAVNSHFTNTLCT